VLWFGLRLRVRRFPDSFRVTLGVALIALMATGCSRSAQSYVDRGDHALTKGDVAAAVLEYRNAVAKDPMLPVARQKLADAYLRQGNGTVALAELVRAADLLPNDAEAQVKAGSLLLIAGRAEDARARADKALSVDPSKVTALVLRANALAGLTDLDGALDQIQQAIALDSRASLQTNLGAIQAARDNQPEAEAAFRRAVDADPRYVPAHLALGQYLWISKRQAEAEAVFKDALQLDATNLTATRALAMLYMQTGRAPEAEPHLRRLVDVTATPEAAFALSDYYVAMKRSQDALAVVQKLSADPAQWGRARAKLAELLRADGKTAEAYAALDEVLAKQPALAGARLTRGRFLLADGKIDQALTDAWEAQKAEPNSPDVHLLLGMIQEAKRDLSAAATSYGQALRLKPRDSTAQMRLAMVQMQRNDLGAATKLAEEALTAQPGDIVAQLVVARSLLASGNIDRAAAVTQQLAARLPDSAVVQNQVGMLALARRDRAGARAAFEKALTLNDRLVEPLQALVSIDMQDGNAAAARARVERRVQASPTNGAVLALAGRTFAATGDLTKGEAYLRRAIEADGANLEAYTDLARVYVTQNKLDQAVAEFDRAATRQPGVVGPQTIAAIIVTSQGKEADAIRRYERLLEASPRAAVAANNLAWIYASRGEQLDRALQLAQVAKQEVPEHPEINDTLAFVYLKKQLPALAIPPLRLAVEKAPGNPNFQYHLGLAHSQSGDKAAARVALKRALDLGTDFDGAADARRLLDTLGG
jgi:putative PEP-CTERM system TPR-repeat lipoprotein